MPRLRILNIETDNPTFRGFLETLHSGMVFTPNLDHLYKLQKDRDFHTAYKAAEHVVCDSRILLWLSKLLVSGGLPEVIAGSELLPAYCRHLAATRSEGGIFLLGGTPESVQCAQSKLNSECGHTVVKGVLSPPFGFEHDFADTQRIIGAINQSGVTALAVGVGAPKQELWIHQHRHEMPGVRVFLAVGAAIDFAGGRVPRAPRWMNRLGLEWLFRLVREPQRLARRYLVEGPQVIALIILQRLGRYRDPWA